MQQMGVKIRKKDTLWDKWAH